MNVYINTGSGSSSLKGHVDTMGPIGSLDSIGWTHCAVTRNGNTMTLFLNGRVIDSRTETGDFTGQGGVTIGSRDGSTPFKGWISNLRLIKGTTLYNSTFTPPTSELLG